MTNQLDESLADALRVASSDEKADLLLDYIRDHGSMKYDSNVTQMEHALQTAKSIGIVRHMAAPPLQLLDQLVVR